MLRFRKTKVLKQLIIISVCVSAFLGIWLLRNAHTVDINSRYSANLTANNHLADSEQNIAFLKHPRNLFPAFVRHQKVLQKSPANLSQTTSLNLTSPKKTKQVLPIFHNMDISQDTNDADRLELFGVDASTVDPCYEIHTFYYPWYGNPEHDGRYLHWNHPFLPHWNAQEAKRWPKGSHVPPDDVGANFYPLLGAYSSADPEVVDKHMQMVRYAKIGVVVVSWYPAGDADNEGMEPDSLMPLLLDAAHKYKLKVAIHVEPFKNRNQVTMREQIRYIMDKYGRHPAFYRTSHGRKINLPLIYIYDSYLVDSSQWSEIFADKGSMTVRKTELDAIFIGLLVDGKHQDHILKSGFDGFYTYFGTNGFTFGSTWKNWPHISQWAERRNLLFIPSVGPGYIDTEVRPWNGQNTRHRVDGKYYRESFLNAINVKPPVISITSFNEWHEGTQIEPAVRKSAPPRHYLDYGPKGAYSYLNMTREWVEKFTSK